MSKLLKVYSPKDIDLQIDYSFTFRCNYDCSYCTSHDVNHPLLTRTYKEISDSLNYLTSFYPNKNIGITFLGGEPFLYKDLVKVIINLDRGYSIVLTNLSISKTYIKKNFLPEYKDKFRIKASWHPEFSNPDEFIEKILLIKDIGYNIRASVCVHTKKEFFDKAVYILDKLPDISDVHTLWNMASNNITHSKLFEYTDYQKQIMNRYIDKQKESGYEKAVQLTYDDKVIEIDSRLMFIDSLTNFKGMKCYAGHEKLHILENGNVFGASCFLSHSKLSLGNMFNKTFRVPTSVITCPFTFCGCIGDIKITKEAQK